MTINTETNRIDFVGNGSTTIFPYPYPVQQEDTMKVFLDLVAQTSGFTVNGVGDPAGGDVTFDVAPATGVAIILIRILPFLQLIDYTAFDPFPADTHETGLDEGTMIDIQLQEQITNLFESPVFDTDELKTSIGLWFPSVPGNAAVISGYVFDRRVTFPVNLVNSRGFARATANAETTISLRRNEVEFGTAVWPAGLAVAAFAGILTVFEEGDQITFHNQAVADISLGDIMITLQGDRP